MWLFKALGLLFLFTACAMFGFLKSESLKKRKIALGVFIKALSQIAELVRIGTYEIEELCRLCFETSFVKMENGAPKLLCEELADSDKELIEEYFKGFGLTDTESEYKRTKLYISLLEQQYSSAAELYSKQGGLYRSVGLMGGLILCIFFM